MTSGRTSGTSLVGVIEEQEEDEETERLAEEAARRLAEQEEKQQVRRSMIDAYRKNSAEAAPSKVKPKQLIEEER